MNIMSSLSDPGLWQEYLEYKRSSGRLLKREEQELTAFIAQEKYRPVVDNIRSGGTFPPPKKSAISKMNSTKKRIVYTYPSAENQVLKLMTYLLLRQYDGCFSDNLYSFRAGRTPKDAIRRLTRQPEIDRMWSYKADISNYFNSIPVNKLLPMLEKTRETARQSTWVCLTNSTTSSGTFLSFREEIALVSSAPPTLPRMEGVSSTR